MADLDDLRPSSSRRSARGVGRATGGRTRAAGGLSHPGTSVQPGVAPVVVAVALPEALFVVVHQGDPGDPLRALPEVQVRHQQPHRAAVIGRQRPSLVGPDHPGLAAGDVGQRQVGGVPGGRGGHDERRLRRRAGGLQQGVDADPAEAGAELGPGGDAVDVAFVDRRRQRVRLVPGPGRRGGRPGRRR